jgi:hypothetical protein
VTPHTPQLSLLLPYGTVLYSMVRKKNPSHFHYLIMTPAEPRAPKKLHFPKSVLEPALYLAAQKRSRPSALPVCVLVLHTLIE